MGSPASRAGRALAFTITVFLCRSREESVEVLQISIESKHAPSLLPKLETRDYTGVIIGVILGLYKDNGKQHGNYYSRVLGFRVQQMGTNDLKPKCAGKPTIAASKSGESL